METVLSFNDPSTWLFYFTAMLGMGMVIFANGGNAFIGIFVLFMNGMILQADLQKESDIRFVYEQFEKAQPVECGLWRGTRVIADPAQGWILEGGWFVKGDTVLNDPGLCSVVGKGFPEYIGFEPLIFFFCVLGFSLLARLGIRSQEGKPYWSDESVEDDPVPDVSGSDEAKGE